MMAQNEQTPEEHSTLEQQSPRRLDHPAWCVVTVQMPAKDNRAIVDIVYGSMRLVGIRSNANDAQKIFAFHSSLHSHWFLFSRSIADFHDLYISSDEKLFNKILPCPNHILQTLLPPPAAKITVL